MKTCCTFILVGVATVLQAMSASIQPIAYRVPAKLPDKAELLSPADIQLQGMLGVRVANNEKNRLVKVDLEPLLAGFRKKPGSHPWIGEHIGKWLHASTLAWANTGDTALREKMDYAVAELIKAQEPDGYLGTYVPEKRFGLYSGADWDVWSHKYNLIGLLTYHQYTGNESALAAARKIGDLLIATFGEGKKSIISAGTHVGMAATSVLEPVVLLYRFTGEEKYLDFAKYIVRSWDEPNGPKIIASLLEKKSVQKTANGKAYEMLSNLVGLCELARVTGDSRMLQACLNAWEDIVAHRLYITGSASQGEHFHADYELPNETRANVSETCVTTTWIQFNLQLLRLTGEGRLGTELEKTFLNHLAAAQRPDGAQWCYFTALEGAKPYGPGINCCVSSGPRGMALVPQAAWLKIPAQGGDPEALALNLFESSILNTRIGNQPVTLTLKSGFPVANEAVLTVKTEAPVKFALHFRKGWIQALNGNDWQWAAPYGDTPYGSRDWIVVPQREWKDGASLTLKFNCKAVLAMGDHSNAGKAALTWGPYVLGLDQAANLGLPVARVGFGSDSVNWANSKSALEVSPEAASAHYPFTLEAKVRTPDGATKTAVFSPFAEAGRSGSRYQIWLRAPGVELPKNDSVTSMGEESRSRPGNLAGSIIDGDTSTAVVTFDGKPAQEDWFAVRLDAPVEIRRVVFAHGKSFHDGGWFDASAGKPRVQAQRAKGGAWEDLAVIEDYPATTPTDSDGLKDGQAFAVKLKQAEKIIALRVIGKPGCGDNRSQAFASCGELQAFAQ